MQENSPQNMPPEMSAPEMPAPASASRKPGERGFAIFLAVASAYLLYSAYGISGFTALSGAGAIPMAASLAMVITAAIVALRTARLPAAATQGFFNEVLPLRIAVIAGLLIAYAFALQPIGFLPTSAAFLILAIKFLGRRSWVFSVGTGLLSLLAIYLVFRIIFTVLMPSGIVPEGEILAWLRGVFGGGV